MELAENGDLQEFLTGGDPHKLAEKGFKFDPIKMGRQILEAIAHIHSIKIIHRDIKGQNILLDIKFDPKISDFGSVKDNTGTASVTANIGTVLYMSPEGLFGSD